MQEALARYVALYVGVSVERIHELQQRVATLEAQRAVLDAWWADPDNAEMIHLKESCDWCRLPFEGEPLDEYTCAIDDAQEQCSTYCMKPACIASGAPIRSCEHCEYPVCHEHAKTCHLCARITCPMCIEHNQECPQN